MAETASLAPSASTVAPVGQLARAWLASLAASRDETPTCPGTAPEGDAGARAFLAAQSATLLAILFGDPFRPQQAAAVGHALVQADFFAGGDVLGSSLRVLISRLPGLIASRAVADPKADTVTVAGLERRIAELSGALANGYVRALRDRTLAEQESIRRAEVEAQRSISERLRHQANHDPLTGLPNRSAVLGWLASALAADPGTLVGLCYLDLDGFKAVNDRHGHGAGDELLVTVAGRISEVARARDSLAGRIGGDEFIVLVPASPGIAGMISLATAILAEVRRPIELRAGCVAVSACAGITECAAGSPAAATIVTNADTALYQAKSRGRGRWAVYDATQRQAS